MKKGPLLGIITSILLINFVSAFSFGEFFDSFGQENFTLFMIFIISLILIHFSLSKVFSRKSIGGSDRKTPALISLFLALGVTYAFYKTGWSEALDFSDLFFSLGVPEDLISMIIGIVFILGAIILIYKFGCTKLFLTLGILTIIGTFISGIPDIFIPLVIGTVLIFLGLLCWFFKRKGSSLQAGIPKGSKSGKKKFTLIMDKRGNGEIKPKRGYSYHRKNERVTIKIKKGDFQYFVVDGYKEKRPKFEIKMNQDHNIVAIFGKNGSSGTGTPPPGPTPPPGTPPEKGNRESKIRELIAEAKAFRKWADSQNNPKFYKNWANFINWLKKKGYGKNEKEIMDNLILTRENVGNVVKKYIL